MSEQRRQPRIPFSLVGKIDLGDRALPCVIMNLSEGGLAVLTDADELPAGPVRIELRLGRHGAREHIDAELVERRASDVEGAVVWGLRALPMELGTRVRLRDLVQRETRAAC